MLIMLLGAFGAWKDIPKNNNIKGSDVFALALADGALVGWASKIGAGWFYPDSGISKVRAEKVYVDVMNYGEQYHSSAITWGLVIGTFISIGGVIAVWMARSASSVGEAFKLGFFAEIAEGVVYHVGYITTMGRSTLSTEEVGITLVVAIIMGLVAMGAYNSHHK